jgi:hypothetical protein
MAETERTLHDELVDTLWCAIDDQLPIGEAPPTTKNLDAAVDALLPVFERRFRERLLRDEAIRAAQRELVTIYDSDNIWSDDDARCVLSAALDHVCGPEGGESRG